MFSTNTATDPNTQFQFYTLALAVANQAINSSREIWGTTVTGGSTVPILAPTAVQMQTTTAANPLQIGPFSVTSVTW